MLAWETSVYVTAGTICKYENGDLQVNGTEMCIPASIAADDYAKCLLVAYRG